jgi:AcrR family transcriptional regulator
MSNDQNMEQAILKAATKLFLEKGFASTSTTEIAKEAGCNQALVHYYYRTKDRLFDAIFQEKVKFFIGSLLKLDNKNLPYLEKLAKKIESHFEAIKSDPKIPLFFFSEISTNPQRLKTLRENIGEYSQLALKQMENDLNEAIKQGIVRPMSIYDLMMTIVSLNVMGFIGEPIFRTISGLPDEQYAELLNARKAENVRIIIGSLKPS